jgi:hypothetical protein
VETENDAHDFFGKGLGDWQKNVTGRQPSKDATNLKKQFDDYEQSVLSTVPKGGKRHAALTESLPKIKDTFLKQGHQFALDKLNERSRTVLDKGLQRLAKGALGAKGQSVVQAHDDAAFDFINKYVLSEARFDEKDADAMYDKYLGYAGVEKPRPAEGEALGHGDRQETIAPKTKAPTEAPSKSSAQHAREMETTVETRNRYPEPKDNYPFDEKTYEFLGKHKDAINSAAGKFGVSPEAVAGAMGDEFNRSNFVDPWQDKYVAVYGSLDKVEGEIKEGFSKGIMGKLDMAGQDIGPGNMRVETLHKMFVDRVEIR